MQIGETAHVLQADVRDLRIAEVEVLQVRETAQMLKARVGDLRVVEPERLQVGETAQARPAFCTRHLDSLRPQVQRVRTLETLHRRHGCYDR